MTRYEQETAPVPDAAASRLALVLIPRYVKGLDLAVEDRWLNTMTNVLSRWDGSQWVPLGGGAGAPTDAKYITQTPHADLSAEQSLSALATGLVKNTTGTGVLSIGVADADYAAAAHAARHQDVGADELNVAGLSGVLADPQPPIIGAGSTQAVAGNDSRLANARTPTAHAPSHKAGGSDAMALDELAAPTDITTLNSTTSAHGLVPKLSGVATQYLDGTGAFSTPAGGGGGPTTLKKTADQTINGGAGVFVDVTGLTSRSSAARITPSTSTSCSGPQRRRPDIRCR